MGRTIKWQEPDVKEIISGNKGQEPVMEEREEKLGETLMKAKWNRKKKKSKGTLS